MSSFARIPLDCAVKDFSTKHFFTMQLNGARAMQCSRLTNTHSKKKEKGLVVLVREASASCTNCEYEVCFTKSGKIESAAIRKVKTIRKSGKWSAKNEPNAALGSIHNFDTTTRNRLKR